MYTLMFIVVRENLSGRCMWGVGGVCGGWAVYVGGRGCMWGVGGVWCM